MSQAGHVDESHTVVTRAPEPGREGFTSIAEVFGDDPSSAGGTPNTRDGSGSSPMAEQPGTADDEEMNPTDLRVSDAEREPVIDRLQQAYAEGRLDDGEFEVRMQLAMTAKTRGDLAAVTYDLVPAGSGRGTVPYAGVPADVTGEDRMLAGLAHASGYFTTFVGPLVFLLLSGKRSEYVRRHAAEALNFQLTVLLVVMVTFGVGALLYAVTWILALVAGIAGLSGQSFRYPFTLRLVR